VKFERAGKTLSDIYLETNKSMPETGYVDIWVGCVGHKEAVGWDGNHINMSYIYIQYQPPAGIIVPKQTSQQ
jgi:hypothetical protein